MSSREVLAYNYLIFRYPTEYLLVMFPVVVGIFANIFSSSLSPISGVTSDNIVAYQYEDFDLYLYTSKITIIILIAFFICYRWANMLSDGSYGFWLTTGVVRGKFYFRTINKFAGILFFAQFLGLILILLMNQYFFSIGTIAIILLALASSVFFQVTTAVFLGNLLKNPEFASLSYLTIMGFNLGFNNQPTNIFYYLFQSDLAYRTDSAIISALFSILFSTVIAVISLRIHLSQDIDI